MSTESEIAQFNQDRLAVQMRSHHQLRSEYVESLLCTIDKQKRNIKELKEVAVLEGIALLLTIYYYVV